MGAVTQPVPQPQTPASPGSSEAATSSAPTEDELDQARVVWQHSELVPSGVRVVVGGAAVISGVFVVVIPNWATILTGLVTLLAVAMTWGWRLNSSGTGLITQSGPGLRLTRTNGRILEITSDDAASAVKVLARYSSTI
jgi:hypothetical protein